MLVKLLNVCGVIFIVLIVTSFSIAGFTPEVAEDIFTIPWLSVSMGILMFIVSTGTMTNVIRKHYKGKPSEACSLFLWRIYNDIRLFNR
ncbi:hypothetical protein SAMN04488054_10925 [Salibacterium qingdaonense]|uniref:Uncharacterized protein n=1 Tax=Salibacterium qingdaonense TaxID=266892 RepID=A0A1I4LW38_9BACI|nr:hypothetical protein SAMN04488054_10925 [Salibacterium qingdaonense]